MAIDTNVVVLVGRLTKDAKGTNIGESFKLDFSMAVNGYKDDVSYFDVEYWGKGAESVSQWLEKGRQISVEGSLKQSRWDKDGRKGSKVFVRAESVQLLGGGRSVEQEAPSPQQTLKGPEAFDDGDDIPF